MAIEELKSSFDRYSRLVDDGTLTPDEAKELMKKFPLDIAERKTFGDVRVIGNAELESIERDLLPSGYRMRKHVEEVIEFRNRASGDVHRYIVDRWMR
ncbi:MAG: hypothetical protein H5U22_06670 [Rhizobium sp.]|nr:hypothetical protein [Rhizobium sp.]